MICFLLFQINLTTNIDGDDNEVFAGTNVNQVMTRFIVGQVADGRTVLVPEDDEETRTLLNLNVDVEGDENMVVLNTNLDQLNEGTSFVDPESNQVFIVRKEAGRPFLELVGDQSNFVSFALIFNVNSFKTGRARGVTLLNAPPCVRIAILEPIY